MQQSVEAMIAAVAIVQPALDKFYSLLNDEQKARPPEDEEVAS
jgi:LTXXQ motif family protein